MVQNLRATAHLSRQLGRWGAGALGRGRWASGRAAGAGRAWARGHAAAGGASGRLGERQ